MSDDDGLKGQDGLKRGERNCNPGNLDRDGTPWAGMAEDQSGDPRFIVFQTPYFGVRALARTLLNYQRQHGLDSVAAIVARWAPPSENDTSAYIDDVSERVGVDPHQTLDLGDPETLAELTKAMITHEQGRCIYTDALIDQAVESALS